MMGKQHAVMGAAGWILVTAPQPIGLGMIEAGAISLIAGSVMARGAATLPDMDHTSASPTRALPPFTRWGVSKLIGKLFGGHRNGTHAIIGILSFAIAALLASTIRTDSPIGELQIGSMIVAAFVTILGLQVSGIKGLTNYVLSAAIGFLTVYGGPDDTIWIPLVVLLGAFIHSLGDFMTVAGINWIWPFVIKPKGGKDKHYGPIVHLANGRWAMPIFGVTGEGASRKHKRRMYWFMTILNVYIFFVIAIAALATIMTFSAGGNPLTDPISDNMSQIGNLIFENISDLFQK